jgi:hypothetical protein
VKVLEGDIAAANWLADPKNLGTAAAIAQITGDSPDVARDALDTYVRAKWWNASESGLTVQRITRTIGLGLRLGIIPPSGNSLSWKTVTDPSLWKAASSSWCRAP